MIFSSLRGIDGDEEFAAYCTDSISKYCPFIRPSAQNKLLFATRYSPNQLLEESKTGDLESAIFFACILHAEQVRIKRLTYADSPLSRLICDNVILDDRPQIWGNHEQLISWPHWILKSIYTSSGLMFGKFWIDENLKDAGGDCLPPPRDTFLSIRSTIKVPDRRFLASQIDVCLKMQESEFTTEPTLPDGLRVSELVDNTKPQRLQLYAMLKKWSARSL